MLIPAIRQFPCVRPTGRGYYCAKEEFHANFYNFTHPRGAIATNPDRLFTPTL